MHWYAVLDHYEVVLVVLNLDHLRNLFIFFNVCNDIYVSFYTVLSVDFLMHGFFCILL
jgi:hypothetical protein